ncbi:cysteate racemase [Tissierella creatinophila]|uniref:Aspartate racemase n=1 Tax=Tissierella creatinophila DSM 6911 TaxID=1123403 RepID=A0A1U7M700_TISCR|nr:amino acid racemase [Tissierella creatinophila]OLS03030.1 aspartate racemase [Tissierella creatinophila DSM 6911]
MQVLGILGGMGPLATVKLFEMIVSMTDANNDQEHIHIIVDNNTKVPDRTSFLLDKNKENPNLLLIESAKRLEKAGVDLIVMPCNTAHYYYEEIKSYINIPFLNMIEETAIWIKENYPSLKKIGLLATDGTIKAGIYDEIFLKYDIEIITPSKDKQKYIYELIYNMKENKNQKSLDGIYSAMSEIENEGAEIFIAGCTEVSVALNTFKIEGEFVDPMKIISEKAIKLVGAKLKDKNN